MPKITASTSATAGMGIKAARARMTKPKAVAAQPAQTIHGKGRQVAPTGHRTEKQRLGDWNAPHRPGAGVPKHQRHRQREHQRQNRSA